MSEETDSKELGNTGKRKPPAAGKGRAKGALNKTTKEVKEMLLGALEENGGQAYFSLQAKKNPQAFMALIGKILPKDMNLKIGVAPNIIDEFPNLKR